MTDTYTYDAFGVIRSKTGPTTNVWRLTDEQEDGGAGDTGYYFLRARYYDPGTGRFISKDVVPFAQRYAYVSNNPVAFRDPLGLCRRPGSEPKSNGFKWFGQAIADALDCSIDAGAGMWGAVMSEDAMLAADTISLGFNGAAAGITDLTTVAGCAVVGVGCGLGYALGNVATQPFQGIANVASIYSTLAGCARSQDSDCLMTGLRTAAGWVIPEPNFDVLLDVWQLEADLKAFGRAGKE